MSKRDGWLFLFMVGFTIAAIGIPVHRPSDNWINVGLSLCLSFYSFCLGVKVAL